VAAVLGVPACGGGPDVEPVERARWQRSVDRFQTRPCSTRRGADRRRTTALARRAAMPGCRSSRAGLIAG
jgi:hypothetical protein